MLAHVPYFGRNPRGAPDLLAYPVPNRMDACSWYWRSEVLGCRTLRLESQSRAGLRMQPHQRSRVTFGRVTCMARAASVPGLWTLRFLLLCGACVRVWVLRKPRHSWLGSRVSVLGYVFWFRPSIPGWGSWCVRLGLGLCGAVLSRSVVSLRCCSCLLFLFYFKTAAKHVKLPFE